MDRHWLQISTQWIFQGNSGTIGGMKQARKQIVASPIVAERVRRIAGGFSFVPHRFLLDGFLGSLTLCELSLYFLLIVAGDRNGVSFYGAASICNLLCLDREAYLLARNGLIGKDLIAFDGRRYQVLSLPQKPLLPVLGPLMSEEDLEEHDPATIQSLIEKSLRHREEDHE
jgi:hypothetical protein